MNTSNTTLEPVAFTYNLVYSESLITDQEKDTFLTEEDGLAVLKQNICRTPLITVHSGEFHADELVSIALLEIFLNIDPRIIRTRDESVLANACVRLDVGQGILDHHGDRYEDHVATCTKVFALLRQSSKLSAFGLLPSAQQKLAAIVDEVAATDCGEAEPNWITEVVQSYSRGAMAHAYNIDGDVEKERELVFSHVLSVVRDLLFNKLEEWMATETSTAFARKEIEEAGDSHVVVFSADSRLANCKKMLHMQKAQAWYFVSPEKENDWRILCCADPAVEFNVFNSWHPIPGEFCGLRGESLTEKTGIPGGIFVHAAGFIGGFKTRESAIRFADLCVSTTIVEERDALKKLGVFRRLLRWIRGLFRRG